MTTKSKPLPFVVLFKRCHLQHRLSTKLSCYIQCLEKSFTRLDFLWPLCRPQLQVLTKTEPLSVEILVHLEWLMRLLCGHLVVVFCNRKGCKGQCRFNVKLDHREAGWGEPANRLLFTEQKPLFWPSNPPKAKFNK